MSTLTEDELIRNRLITDEKFLRHAAKLYSQFLVDDGSEYVL